ncbi:Restriction enzyme BgcI subunit beta [Xenorhabdus ishibashii]|uniref:Restriction enzyme BgcI subunit beta n=2 Tax=Xenorhabdus ishibashii TaxID=1034471 RepID=A0A2D0KCR2_9GAMM|nr:Restriction enzyme BgcI subunit beta [Xenorhabdus ishibashii]
MLLKPEGKEWNEFFLKDIFGTVQRGKRLTKNNQIGGEHPYVSSTALNNGVDNFIGNDTGVRIFSNCLTIANSGSVGSSFYHPYCFVASDHVTHLQDDNFNQFIYLFIANQTSRLSEKYNFNREINDRRISRDKIILPVISNDEPDYLFMEEYTNALMDKKKAEYVEHCRKKLAKLEYKEIDVLEDKEWCEFFINDLFDVQIGKNIDGNKVDKCSGMSPYITRKEVNNGNDGFLDYNQEYLFKDTPVITIGNETASPFVQTSSFFTGTKVNILKPKNVFQEKALFFIAQSLRQHKDKYSFSYTINSTRLKRQMILLPVAEDGTPDYDYMAQYTMNLEYRKRKQYLEYLDSQYKSYDK